MFLAVLVQVFGEVSERVISATVVQLWRKGVQLEGCLLKPQMIIPVRSVLEYTATSASNALRAAPVMCCC